jgi:transposase
VLPPERVDAVVEHRAAACRRCGHPLADAPAVGAPARHQLVELPPVRAHVTEHRALTLACPACGTHTRAALPAAVRRHHFGPRLTAFAVTLLGRVRVSRRNLTALLADLLDVPAPALGTTQRFVAEASGALAAPYAEVRTAVRASPRGWVDETSWALRGALRWLWAAATPAATLYRVGRRRNRRAGELLLGRAYAGVLTTDRWRAYDGHPLERRQVCWAHLKRNLQGIADAGGAGAALGRWGVREAERVFHVWHAHRRGELSRAQLRRALVPIRMRLGRLLGHALRGGERRPRALARDLLRLWDGLWTFARHADVEPTNSRAERALRGPVIWRKTSFGSGSGAGLRAVERLLTVGETCRQQGRNVLHYLADALRAGRAGCAAPQLLPAR